MANENFHEATAPKRTTPQGTQAEGVEYGHEAADISIRTLIGWFIALGVSVAVIILLLWGAFEFWSAWAKKSETLPSPLFAVRQIPPEPRVLPNPAESALRPYGPLLGPAQALVEARRKEDEELVKYGLEDPTTHAPKLPERAVAAVVTEQGARPGAGPPGAGGGTGAPQQLMPSDASGGTTLEDRLR